MLSYHTITSVTKQTWSS